ncbi:hypothetical protein C8N43_0863 [Litoreibacter ponti]|uniref:Uncharacterized protein n=1 Tax=Litoreibacter ponti TaxID=1510457 RepID=A0A2T6BJH4_9RHOB|nr:hypothetical protein [Litoreibacter ponti]PTX56210.1 hypothetical protein C8N43_0863 [Litoreibacter ponti]
MRWSKLKQRIEGNFAPEIADRVDVHLTRHRGSHDAEQHGRILVDGELWFDACVFKHSAKTLGVVERETGIASLGLLKEHPEVTDEVKNAGFLPGWQFPQLLFDFLNTPIADALVAKEPLTRILAVLDARVGTRTLAKLQDSWDFALPERRFLDLRTSSKF